MAQNTRKRSVPRFRTGVGTKSRTQQQFVDECDINRIMAKYRRTGVIDHIAARPGLFLELPNDLDFHSAMETVRKGEEAFHDLPSLVRDRFANDPAKFLSFMDNLEENRDEAVRLGLLQESKAPAAPAPAPPAAAPAASGEPPGEPGA